MDNNKTQNLDDDLLADFFDASRSDPPQIDLGFLADLEAQAVASVGKVQTPVSQSLDFDVWGWVRGLVPVGGLVAAALVGVMIGVNPPDMLLDASDAYFQTETLGDLAGDYLLEDYFVEET